MLRKISIILSILVLAYLTTGLAFHFKWKSELAACREARRARGEFVEPEVFGGVLSLIFDVTYWPVYSWANIYHFGTPFATPCVRPSGGLSSEVEVSHVQFGVGRGPFRCLAGASNGMGPGSAPKGSQAKTSCVTPAGKSPAFILLISRIGHGGWSDGGRLTG